MSTKSLSGSRGRSSGGGDRRGRSTTPTRGSSTSGGATQQARRGRSRSPMRAAGSAAKKTGQSLRGLFGRGASTKMKSTGSSKFGASSKSASNLMASSNTSEDNPSARAPAKSFSVKLDPLPKEEEPAIKVEAPTKQEDLAAPAPNPAVEAAPGKNTPPPDSDPVVPAPKADTDVATPPISAIDTSDAGPSPSLSVESLSTLGVGSLQIVLLLLDGASRRFELLQLEFDQPQQAVVSDLLVEISRSATEELLRDRDYTDICDRNGVVLNKKRKLSEVFGASNSTKSELVLAVTKDMNGAECAALAKPILEDPNVAAMINPEGVEVTPNETAAEEAVQETEKTAQVSKDRSINLPKDPPKETKKEAAVDKKPDVIKKKKSGNRFVARIFSMVLFALIATPAVVKIHQWLSSPLGPGDKLSPGSWTNRCGLLSFVSVHPMVEEYTKCHPTTMEMGFDGIATTYETDGTGKRTVLYKLKGRKCSAPKQGDENDTVCVDGLVVDSEGAVRIGGIVPEIEGKNIPDDLTPWPFATDPRKIWQNSKKFKHHN